MATLALSAGSSLALQAGIVGATSLFQAAMAQKQGQAQAAAFKQQAFQEGLSAKDRELERRSMAMRTLASQNVARAAAGITGTGSAAVLRAESEKTIERDLLSLKAGAEGTQNLLRARAANARMGGRISAVSSLLTGALDISRSVPLTSDSSSVKAPISAFEAARM